ncbi:N-acetylmuramoyl-L-alanine amidase family protein [Maribacter aestuarii]|uniref:N-acetylmuramoyl-L-alanine amidase family protein n=1 Tax=Maribacter aestuarii TaxID=1130723 RepID=UPI0025A5870D|nr:N-acetylmuramoyl-L-alanine amidase [Maribacter aestuarii]
MRIKRLLVVPFSVLCLALFSYTASESKTVANEPFVVVLDAGHGGHDPGNLGNGYLEKQIALNIVLKVGEILSSNKDIKVIYTRKDDTFIDLYVRGEVANKANADLFVSVHCDSHSSDANGAGTFVLGLHANKQNFEIAKKENSVIYLEDNYETRYADYDINSPESVIGLTIMQEEFLDQSIALAKMIQDNFSDKLKRNNRKVKQAGFIVLHQTFMPSVLVETGFLTNKDEGAYLDSKKGQLEMATAIANAIVEYKKGVSVSSPSIASAEPIPPKAEEPLPTEERQEKPLVAVENETEEALPIVKKEPVDKIDDVQVDNNDVENNVVKEVVNNEASKPTAVANDIIYKVQIMASGKDLALTRDNFNGLGMLSKEPFNNLYRYMYGETNSYSAAKKIQSSAVLKGYKSAYIVAYKDGVRVPVPKDLE